MLPLHTVADASAVKASGLLLLPVLARKVI